MTTAVSTGARTSTEPAIEPPAPAPQSAASAPAGPTGSSGATAAADAAGAPDTPGAASPSMQVGEVPVPHDQDGIDVLRAQIDEIDAELVRLVQQRTAVSHAIGVARQHLGGPRIVYSREMAILERFRVLGPSGTDLGMLLLAMGRGKLGRK